MLDKFIEQMLESAMSGYRPRIEEISQMRVNELVAVKAKMRTHPEDVEAWFDSEIKKAGNIDINGILKKMRLSKHKEMMSQLLLTTGKTASKKRLH